MGTLPDAEPLAVEAPGERGLRANAIGLKDAIILGLASSGPTASMAVALSTIVGASGYFSPLTILICFLPMMGIALAYRRLNRWEASCGATYTWAGRAISPYFGFMVGWIMLLAYFVGTISDVLPIGPYVLQVIWPSQASSNLGAAISGSIWLIVVAAIAYIGIHATARLQWLFAGIEYAVVFIFAIFALVAVFGGNSRSVPFTWHWFSWKAMGGTTGLVNGILVAVYLFSGWDSAVYVNEETTDRKRNPGRAAITSVLMLGIMYSFLTFAYQGAVHSKELANNGSNALAYIALQLAGSPWDKIMILAVLLSVVGATQTAVVSGSRIALAMGRDRVLPPVLGRISRRHKTPAVATLLFAGGALMVLWLYLEGGSNLNSSFTKIVSTVGLFFALFYAATALSMAVYYRRLAIRGLGSFLELALIPVLSAAFLIWVAIRSVPGLGGWGGSTMTYVYVMVAVGGGLLIVGRVTAHPGSYFHERPEAYEPAG